MVSGQWSVGSKTKDQGLSYSSASNLPRVGLYFSGLVVLAGTRWDGLGLPTLSRAISRTALAALKVFFFRRFRGMAWGSRDCVTTLLSPLWGLLASLFYPWLTPWAVICRRFAAFSVPSSCIFAPEVPKVQ